VDGMEQTLDAKTAVLRLVDEVGFDPVEGGDLDDSWRQQPGTPAYCQTSTPLLSSARSSRRCRRVDFE